MKNYRIIEMGGRFYPQYRSFLFFWFHLSFCDDGGGGIFGYDSLQNARAAIANKRNQDQDAAEARVVWTA